MVLPYEKYLIRSLLLNSLLNTCLFTLVNASACTSMAWHDYGRNDHGHFDSCYTTTSSTAAEIVKTYGRNIGRTARQCKPMHILPAEEGGKLGKVLWVKRNDTDESMTDLYTILMFLVNNQAMLQASLIHTSSWWLFPGSVWCASDVFGAY